MDTDSHLADRVSTLDGILEEDWIAVVDRPDHFAFRDEHPPRSRVVGKDIAGVERLVPPWSRSDEVDDRNRQFEGRAQRSIVRLIDSTGAIGIEDPFGCLL